MNVVSARSALYQRTGAILSAALLAIALVATPASAATNPATADCVAHAGLTHSYSAAQLQNALDSMATDVKQYTDCYDVIQQALFTKLGKTSVTGKPASSTSTSGSFLPVPILALLIVFAIAAAGFGAVAVRRRR